MPGGKPTIYFTFTALVEEGDEVRRFPINFTGATPVPYRIRNPNELADLITDRTKLIVLNSPHNATGL